MAVCMTIGVTIGVTIHLTIDVTIGVTIHLTRLHQISQLLLCQLVIVLQPGQGVCEAQGKQHVQLVWRWRVCCPPVTTSTPMFS